MVNISTSSEITKNFKYETILFGELHTVTEKLNYSSFEFTGGYRDSVNLQNFTNILIYDFDTGELSIKELKSFLKASKVTAFIATSRNHMKDKKGLLCERFRLIIRLSDKLIIPKELYSAFYIFVARVLNIDKFIDTHCKDVARFYFPNPNQEYHYVLTDYCLCSKTLVKNFMQIHKLEEELKQNQENVNKTEGSKRAAAPVNKSSSSSKLKKNEVSPSTDIEIKNGEIRQLKSFSHLAIDETVPCRCINPSHNDKHPSAFVTRAKNNNQRLMVVCKGCNFIAFMAAE